MAGRNRSFCSGGPDLRDQRPALAVGDPVVPDGRAPAQQLLGHDEPLDRGTVTTAVLPGQRHAHPPARGQRLRELGVLAPGHAQAGFERPARQRRRQELADLGLERALDVVELGELELQSIAPASGDDGLAPDELAQILAQDAPLVLG